MGRRRKPVTNKVRQAGRKGGQEPKQWEAGDSSWMTDLVHGAPCFPGSHDPIITYERKNVAGSEGVTIDGSDNGHYLTEFSMKAEGCGRYNSK